MASPEGTDGEGKGCCGWFEVEAIVEKKTGDKISDDESDEEDEIDTDLDGFIDDSYIQNIQADRETAQQLLQVQTAHADKQTLQKLKRKYIASPLSDISNQQTVCREGVKRRLILSDLQTAGMAIHWKLWKHQNR